MSINFYLRLRLALILPLVGFALCAVLYVVGGRTNKAALQDYSLKGGSLLALLSYPAMSLRYHSLIEI